MSEFITVPKLEKSERLDKFLVEKFPQSSRAYWKEHLAHHVQVDGKRARKGQVLQGGEKIALLQTPPQSPAKLIPNPKIQLQVLYEDPYLLAIDKPAGLPCLPLKSEERDTVVHGLLAQYPQQSEVDPETWECGLLHRLDNDTSGVLLLARSSLAKKKFSKLQKEGGMLKEYQAWVHGKVESGGVIRDPIAHHPKNKRKMLIPQDEKQAKKLKAQAACTQYEVLKVGTQYSLLRVAITQGRRHQIRVHLAHLGHPVVGDALYGKENDFPHHLLHAARTSFRHPFLKQKVTITAALPKNFGIKKDN